MRSGPIVGFFVLLSGVFLLAYTQVSRAFLDPRRLELGGAINDRVGDPTFTILSSLLIAAGLATIFGSVSQAKGWRRGAALGGLGISTFVLLSLHLTLYINAITYGPETDLVSYFTASYLFHTGQQYALVAVFILFLLSVGLLAVLVGSAAYLLMPSRFGRAIADARDWGKNESNLVTSSLLLVFSLTIFLVYLVRIAVQLEHQPLEERGFFAQNLLLFYYFQIFFLGLLGLTVAARVFLVNWGSSTPLDRSTIRDSLNNIGRAERGLVAAVLVFNLLILMSPSATQPTDLSQDPVFLVDSKGLALFFFLLAVPYLPYALSLRRLHLLLGQGQPFVSSPFSQLSLRLVLADLAGLALLTAVGVGAHWSPLGLMIAYAAWTGGVFLVGSVTLRLDRGLLEPSFRSGASAPLFFAFVVLSLATSLMMWGAGNTYVATYQESSQTLTIENASPYGAEILFRFAGASLLAFTLLFSLAVAKRAAGIKRSFVGSHIVSFASLVLLAMVVFSVNVWSNNQNLSDAYAGFGFHQYYTEEKILVGILVFVVGVLLFWSLGRIVGALVRPRPLATVVAAYRLQ